MKKTIITTLFLITIFLGSFQFASASPTKCGDSGLLPPLIICGRSGTGSCSQPCELKDIGKFLNNLVYFFIYIMFLVMPIIIIYIGVELIMAQGKSEMLNKVKANAWRVVYSIVLFLCAWIIIYTIVKIMGVRSNIPSFLIKDGQNSNSFIINQGTKVNYSGNSN
jgi:hypothetical protein